MNRLIGVDDRDKSIKPDGISNQIDFRWGVKIPMRDGIHLNATLYLPRVNLPVPAVFTLTPYIADGTHLRGTFFAQNGYAFACVDSRGRGNSEGDFEPLANEARDGYGVVEWLAAQPWCDGQVSMWGGSYCGADQWLTMREAPPHLKTIVPVASAYAGVDFPFYKNIFTPFLMQWLTYVSGKARNLTIMNDPDFWIATFKEMFLQHRPYEELDQVVGNLSTHFQTWVKHPCSDDYWDEKVYSAEQFDRINLPILTITGHYDDDQLGAMEYYRRHMRSESSARAQHYLIVGPWDHPGTRDPKPEFGGMKFSEASLLDMNKLHQGWYDWTMKGGEKPAFLKNRVAYYVMGEESWKYAASLEDIPTSPKKMYLSSLNGANDVFASGDLQDTIPSGLSSDSFIYDPLDTRIAELESNIVENFITDQIYDLNLFGNGLVYHTSQFEHETEITGWVKLCAWISMDVPDTDFKVTLSEVLPDGTLIRLTQDWLRARYRESARHEKLIVPGEINQYTFDGFTFFSRRISKGSRLRLILRCANTIHQEKNYNSGGVVAEESGKDARTAHVTLHHTQQYPSYLELPVVSRS